MLRADTELQRDVIEALSSDESLRGADIDVRAHNEVVTLRGDVELPEHREHAARVALYTPGVWRVVNHLQSTTERRDP